MRKHAAVGCGACKGRKSRIIGLNRVKKRNFARIFLFKALMNKKTVVLGATPNPSRFAYMAVKSLSLKGHEVAPVGVREGAIEGYAILQGEPDIKDVDTVTLYLNAERQRPYYDYIFSLNPKRIIFNPGAENDELYDLAREKGVEPVEACTLVMLSIGNY